MRYTKESLQKLKDSVNVVDVISSFIPLTKVGNNHLGTCPFCKGSSFYVIPSNNQYCCVGCGAHGDALIFLIEHCKVDFKKAVKILSSLSGIPLKEEGISVVDMVKNKDDDNLFFIYKMPQEDGKAVIKEEMDGFKIRIEITKADEE